jgi:hypothetical protein
MWSVSLYENRIKHKSLIRLFVQKKRKSKSYLIKVGVKIKSGEILPNFKKKGVKYFNTYARTLRIKIYFSLIFTNVTVH